MTLDVFELHPDPDTGRDVPHLLRSKQFTNGRVAESYFMDKVGSQPSNELPFITNDI